MKLRLDQDKCRGFGICFGIAPDYFDIPSDGIVAVLVKEVVDDGDVDLARQSVRNCPAGAITLSDD